MSGLFAFVGSSNLVLVSSISISTRISQCVGDMAGFTRCAITRISPISFWSNTDGKVRQKTISTSESVETVVVRNSSSTFKSFSVRFLSLIQAFHLVDRRIGILRM